MVSEQEDEVEKSERGEKARKEISLSANATRKRKTSTRSLFDLATYFAKFEKLWDAFKETN